MQNIRKIITRQLMVQMGKLREAKILKIWLATNISEYHKFSSDYFRGKNAKLLIVHMVAFDWQIIYNHSKIHIYKIYTVTYILTFTIKSCQKLSKDFHKNENRKWIFGHRVLKSKRKSGWATRLKRLLERPQSQQWTENLFLSHKALQ